MYSSKGEVDLWCDRLVSNIQKTNRKRSVFYNNYFKKFADQIRSQLIEHSWIVI